MPTWRSHARGSKPFPPATAGRSRRKLTFESRRFFTSRHGKVAQFQSLGHERVATLAFTLKVHPVTGGTEFQALLFHFKPGGLTFELLNALVQSIDLRPVTARWSGGQRLVLNLGEIDGDAHLSVIAGPRDSLRRRASALAASGLAPSRSPSSAYVRLSMLIGSPIEWVAWGDHLYQRCAAFG